MSNTKCARTRYGRRSKAELQNAPEFRYSGGGAGARGARPHGTARGGADAILAAKLDRRRALEAVLTESIREKDQLLDQRSDLLHEVNHRAKNSIAIVAAMLRLQMGRQAHT